MSDTAIEVRNLSKLYRIGERKPYKTLRESLMKVFRAPAQVDKNELWALRDVSFDVKRGEVIGIIGRNGAGKSTLLKVLSRISGPTRGRVRVRGRVGSLLEVGTGFHPELTGRENIFLSGAILGMRRWEIVRKFDEIVAFAEIDRFIDTPVKYYSSGMYMRLAFAVAAHLEPEILIVDEVLAVGDAEFQKKCMGKMSEVAKSGRTVLFVSHNMNAIERLCTRAMLLNHGEIKAIRNDVRSVIKDHLFATDTESQGSEWRNSGREYANPWFKPVHFFIGDAGGKPKAMPVQNDGDAWVHIEGDVEVMDPALTVGYALFSEDGHLLYWSYHTDQAPDEWPTLQIGRCGLRSRIPQRFLNEGVYRAELIGSLHYRQWLFQPGVNAPAIFITIQGGLSDSPLWMVKRQGLLAPVLEWHSYRIHD
jgi:lipopolysaccharide transport system ATP-binding protein